MAEEIRKPANIIIGAGNNREVTLLNSNRIAGEPFRKTAYNTIGINGKGEESANVDLTAVKGIKDKLAFDAIEVYNKEIWFKIGAISIGEEENKKEYVFLYDNRTKTIAQVYQKGKDGKLQRIEADEYLIKPIINGETLDERVKVIDDMLINFVQKGLNSDNETLRMAILSAIKNASGNINAQEVDLKNLNTLRSKIIALREILAKIDFNNSIVKSFYMEYKEESDIANNLPTLKLLKDKDYLNKAFSQLGITGVTFEEFRKLTKTEDMLDENATLSEIDEFKEIEKFKKENNLLVSIINANTNYVGLNERGEFVIFENEVISIPSNGEIYEDKKLAEKLKDIHFAIGTIKQAVFNPDKVEKDKVVKAENILKEKVSKFAEKETAAILKEYLETLVKELDINKLYAVDSKEKYQMLNKFEEAFNYAKKRTILDTENEFVKEMDILTKDKTRIKNVIYGFKIFERGGFDKSLLENPDDIKNIKEYLLVENLPVLSSFGDKLFEKTKMAIGARAYIDVEKNQIVQVDRGINLSNYLTMANLGKMIDNIRKYDENDENSKKYMENLDKGLSKYFYLNKDEKSLHTSENFAKSVELMRKDLSEVVNLLKEKKYNEAKELVNSWDNSDNENLKTFSQWSKNVAENYSKLKMFNNVYYALSINEDQAVKEKIQNYLINPTAENLEQIKADKQARKYRKPLTELMKHLNKTFNSIIHQKEMNVQKLHELNGGVDEERLNYETIDAIAKNLGFSVVNVGKIYYVDKEKGVVIPNTMDRNFTVDKDIISLKEAEFKGKKVYVYDLNEEKFNEHMQEAEKIKTDIYDLVEEKFEELSKKAAEKLKYGKQEKTIGANVSIDVDFGDEETPVEIQADKTSKKEVEELAKNNQKENEGLLNLMEEEEIDFGEIGNDGINPEEIAKEEEKQAKKSNISAAKKAGL